jgi:uncharacterized cupin superfamily protein
MRSMRVFNIHEPEFEYDDTDPEPYRAGMDRLGPKLGAERIGASIYELPPGQSICPYHYEYGEEEWLLVLTGTPTVRTPEGTTELRAGDVVCFGEGPESAHKITNATGETLRVMMLSTRAWPAASVYPDSDKIAIWPARGSEDAVIVRRADKREYYDGEL